MAPRLSAAVVAAGSALAAAGTAHAMANARLLRRPPAQAPRCARRVSALVPARDEQGSIGRCVASLLAQRGVPHLEIVVVDDGSVDATADEARLAGGDDPRLRLFAGAGEPPPGWLGKPWACARLATLATGEVLVFVDADVVLAPDALAATAAMLDAHRLDLVSPYPRQLADGPLPRLVQPLLQWSWLTLLPVRLAERSPRPSLAAANGQLLAMTRAAYDRCGGHAAVRGEVLDDIALLRAVKRTGGRGAVADGTDLAECRMYGSGGELVDGYAKSLWSALGPPPAAAGACALLALAYVVPAAAALRGSRVGLAGYAAGVAGRVVAARRTGGRAWPDPLAHPLSVLALCWLVGLSHARRRAGALRWKGRPVR
ncbi:MAG: glycosyltransferase [Frankiaceae bacterium]